LADRRGRSRRKDRSICQEIRIPSAVLSTGIVRHLRQMAAAAADLNAMSPFFRSANVNDFGSREALMGLPFPQPSPGGGAPPGINYESDKKMKIAAFLTICLAFLTLEGCTRRTNEGETAERKELYPTAIGAKAVEQFKAAE